ncbi:MAG TPA: cbb3-type cytochrome oxidase assembly protein CcoS, partial [Methylophaga sp.]|nr:cbb3-type cytochrome oxidase assembly protein CcoS [Methylophaga sp.]
VDGAANRVLMDDDNDPEELEADEEPQVKNEARKDE